MLRLQHRSAVAACFSNAAAAVDEVLSASRQGSHSSGVREHCPAPSDPCTRPGTGKREQMGPASPAHEDADEGY